MRNQIFITNNENSYTDNEKLTRNEIVYILTPRLFQNLNNEVMETKKYLQIIGICFLFFLGIPIRIKKTTNETDKFLFLEYIRKFNKSYSENNPEFLVRFENFRNSLKMIKKLNENRSSNNSAIYGLTVFSDLSQDEFMRNRLLNMKNSTLQNNYNSYFEYKVQNANSSKDFKKKNFFKRLKRSKSFPAKVDWREKGIISNVYNQKACGACWAFSTIETIEAMNALKVGTLTKLSVQEVIDCAHYGNYGCEGGDSCSLLNWLVATKTKITTEKLYPFIYKTDSCRNKKLLSGVQIKNFSCDNFSSSEKILLEKLAFHGPVAAAVNAINWQYYLGGIIQFHCSGAPQDLNHAVQIVGYDLTGPIPFYIARNSWGSEFGDKGYIYIAIGGNTCGLTNEVTSLDVF